MRAGVPPSRRGPRVEIHRIGGDDIEAAGAVRRDLRERGDGAIVALDGDDALRAVGEQRAREAAGAGADFDHGHAGERAGGAGYAGGEIEIEQEILAERFLRAQIVSFDHLSQRREVVDRAHARADAGIEMRAASLSAAIRLDGSARPVPAMSNAVP